MYNNKNKHEYILFIAPLVLMLVIFLGYPVYKSIIMSFQDWYMIKPSDHGLIGLKNYRAIFKDEAFIKSLLRTFVYVSTTVVFRFVLGFVVAVIVNTKFKMRALARALIIIPWAIPEVVACLIWILMYDKDFGIINYLLIQIGLVKEPYGFLTDPNIALFSAMLVNIWKGFPFVAIMLLAGLQSIPKEMYEAASIDGASYLQQLKNVTIPLLSPISKIIFLLLIIWSIKDFAIAFLLARGGPSRSTEILTIYIYQTAFKFFDFGKAAAAGFVMLCFSSFFTFFYMKIINKGDKT